MRLQKWTPTMSQRGAEAGLRMHPTVKCCVRPTTEQKATNKLNEKIPWFFDRGIFACALTVLVKYAILNLRYYTILGRHV